MLRGILTLEEERVLAKNARGWKSEGHKRRATRKECKRLREEFEVGGFHGPEFFFQHRQTKNFGRQRSFAQRRRRLTPRIRSHEESFLSSWLREDVEGKEEERERLNKEAKEEGSRSGKREVEGESDRG